MNATPYLLQARGLKVSYGRIEALRGVDLAIRRGQVVAVVGANGAGKTTLLRALSGLVPAEAGDMQVCGLDVRQAGTHQLARSGLLHVPEGRGTLQTLSVMDNLRIAHNIRPSSQSFESALAKVIELLPRLGERRDQLAGNLSGGEQQMLALARAVINRPAILLLDEPSLGLSPLMVTEAYRILRSFKDEGLTILLVEQNVKLALRFADWACVLRQGRIVREGLSEELLEDPDFVRHYLGTH